jgi:hypothetical protein
LFTVGQELLIIGCKTPTFKKLNGHRCKFESFRLNGRYARVSLSSSQLVTLPLSRFAEYTKTKTVIHILNKNV